MGFLCCLGLIILTKKKKDDKKACKFHAFKDHSNHLGQKPLLRTSLKVRKSLLLLPTNISALHGQEDISPKPTRCQVKAEFQWNTNVSASKEKRFTAHTECLHSQGPKDQSKAWLPRAVSPMRHSEGKLICVP